MTQKIKVLLLDDKAKNLKLGRDHGGRTYLIPQLHSIDADFEMPEVTDCFELRWLATPAEAREYRDLSMAIAQKDPSLLRTDGWLPEILLVDYALTGDEHAVEERHLPDHLVEELSPLPKLRRCAKEYGIKAQTPGEVPRTDAPHDADDMGCFAGGIIFATLADHPCAPVVITRKNKERVRPDAAFFQWLLAVQSNGLFVARGDPGSKWHELLCDAAPLLRDQVMQLARAGTITLSMDDVLKLSDDGTHRSIGFSSRYGRREFPVGGLFIDADVSSRPRAAKEWALRVLRNDILARLDRKVAEDEEEFLSTKFELMQGEHLADQLWEAYESDSLVEGRCRLSELLVARGQGGLTAEQQTELAALAGPDRFDVANISGVPAQMTCGVHVELRMGEFSDRARRWAVLLTIVRLLQLRLDAAEGWDIERSKGKVPRRFDRRLELPLDARDVYLALFPVPRDPVILPFHEGSPSASWAGYLSALGGGDLCLKIQDVLAGRTWVRGDTPGKTVGGLLPGERFILRLFAEGMGLDVASIDPQVRALLGTAHLKE